MKKLLLVLATILVSTRYEELKTKLEKLKKEEKKVKVVAILPMMEIKDLNE
jgi:hypothetical protein